MNKLIIFIINKINLIKYTFGKAINFIPFKINRVKCKKMPDIRGRIYVENHGSIIIGSDVVINSNLESSQLGFYPKTIMHTGKSGKIFIGNKSGMSNAAIYSKESITIGENVMLGAGVKIYDNDFHDLNTGNNKMSAPVIIEDNVFIGAGSMILKGVTVGKDSIIGAGSVVAKSIPKGEIWAGNPAKFIRKVGASRHEDYTL